MSQSEEMKGDRKGNYVSHMKEKGGGGGGRRGQ